MYARTADDTVQYQQRVLPVETIKCIEEVRLERFRERFAHCSAPKHFKFPEPTSHKQPKLQKTIKAAIFNVPSPAKENSWNVNP
jgi:hypothetical protein